MIWSFLFRITMFSHFLVTYGFRIGIRIYGVDHTYIRLVVRFRSILDSVNRSFQLRKGLILPTVLFKLEDIFSLRDIWYTPVQSFPYNGRFHPPYGMFSQLLCMVTYLSVKASFILVGTYVRAIIITCHAFRSMIANSVDFVSSYNF